MATVLFPDNPTEGQMFENTSVSSEYSEWWIYKDGMWSSDIVASLPDEEIGMTTPYPNDLLNQNRHPEWNDYPSLYISTQGQFNNWQLHGGEKFWRDMRRIVNSIGYQSYMYGYNGDVTGDPSIGSGCHLIPVTQTQDYQGGEIEWPLGRLQSWDKGGYKVHKGDL